MRKNVIKIYLSLFTIVMILGLSMEQVNVVFADQPAYMSLSVDGNPDTVYNYLYNQIKQAVQDINAGTRTDTIVALNLRIAGASMETYTAEELTIDSNSDSQYIIKALLWKSGAYRLIGGYENGQTAALYDVLADFPSLGWWMDDEREITDNFVKTYDVNNTLTSISLPDTLFFKIAVLPQYAADDNEYEIDSSKINSSDVEDIAEGIVEQYADYDDYSRLRAYAQEICNRTSYYSPDNKPFYTSQYGSVFDNNSETLTACLGYSSAFKRLCDLTDFNGPVWCETINGYATGPHAWNVVHIGNGRYLVDVTWLDWYGLTNTAWENYFLAGTEQADGRTSDWYNDNQLSSLSFTISGPSTVAPGATANLQPSNSSGPFFLWTSTNESVAAVDTSGTVTALQPGTATIWATRKDRPDYTACITIDVEIPFSIEVTGSGATRTITVYNAAGSTMDAAVWSSAGGQDDLHWHSMTKGIDGNWRVTIRTSDIIHAGKCNVHVYKNRYDSSTFVGAKEFSVSSDELSLSEVYIEGTGKKRTVYLSTNVNYTNARVAIWSETGGQDDIRWYNMTKGANRIWSVEIPLYNLQHSGLCHAHVYTNSATFVGASDFSVASDDILVNSFTISGSGNTRTASAEIADIWTTLKVAVWSSENGQDDIVWYTMIKDNQGVWNATIQLSRLKHIGQVNAHFYSGQTFLGAKTFTVSNEYYIQPIETPASGIVLNRNEAVIYMNSGPLYLTATVLPENASMKTVYWTSSNPFIASVTNLGVVTPVSTGEAEITATTDDGAIAASCHVVVRQLPTSLTLSHNSLTIRKGNTYQLVAQVGPSNAYDTSVTWRSSNLSVAVVSSSGVITAKRPGSAVITCTTNSGGITATCNVTVSTSSGGTTQ